MPLLVNFYENLLMIPELNIRYGKLPKPKRTNYTNTSDQNWGWWAWPEITSKRLVERFVDRLEKIFKPNSMVETESLPHVSGQEGMKILFITLVEDVKPEKLLFLKQDKYSIIITYRSISILAIISKLFEQLLLKRMKPIIEKKIYTGSLVWFSESTFYDWTSSQNCLYNKCVKKCSWMLLTSSTK